jgi:hypothetical protein
MRREGARRTSGREEEGRAEAKEDGRGMRKAGREGEEEREGKQRRTEGRRTGRKQDGERKKREDGLPTHFFL